MNAADPATAPRAVTDQQWAQIRRESMTIGPRNASEQIAGVLLRYQEELLETTALNAVTLCEKSRRTGATWAVGADAVLTASSARGQGGMDVFYIGYNLDMAREFIDVCAMWARGFNEAVVEEGVQEFVFQDQDERGIDRAIQAFRIRLASGFEIVALPSRPRSLRGKQGYVIVDEAAFHDDLAALMKAALAFLIWGGRVLVISTHLGEDNEFNKLIQDARAGRTPYKIVRFTFDDALKDGLYQRICLTRGNEWSADAEGKWRAEIISFYGEDADEELFCIPSKGGGIFLPRSMIEARMSDEFPVIRLEKPSSFAQMPKEDRERDIMQWCEAELALPLKALDPLQRHAFGEDFGRVSDLTVIAPLAIAQTTKRHVPFGVELRNIPFEQQAQILFYVVDRLPRFQGGAMDATGNGAYLAEVAMQRYGATRIAQIKLNAPWYLQNFPPLKAAFEDATLIIPKDDDVLTDLSLVRMQAGIPLIPAVRTGEQNKRRHGDWAVALVLGYFATRANFTEYGYMAAGQQDEDRPPWMRGEDERDNLIGARGDRLW